jgi:hypothetical protein
MAGLPVERRRPAAVGSRGARWRGGSALRRSRCAEGVVMPRQDAGRSEEPRANAATRFDRKRAVPACASFA